MDLPVRNQSDLSHVFLLNRADALVEYRPHIHRSDSSGLRAAWRPTAGATKGRPTHHTSFMLHPDTELRFINEDIGFGVVATRFIPRGTITWAIDKLDQVIAPERIATLTGIYQRVLLKHAFRDAFGNAILCWDHARFVNHSCAPTSLAPGLNFEIAVRDIHPGEELTDDYGSLNVEAPFRCLCRAPQCRTFVGPDDFLTFADQWDAQIAAAFPLIASSPQPLWELVREKDDVLAVLDGRLSLPSCRRHYLAPAELSKAS